MLHFQRSIELTPDNPALYFHLAVALAKQGKADEAIANFRKAIQLDPNFGAAHSNLANFLPSGATSTKRSPFSPSDRTRSRRGLSLLTVARLLRKQGKTSEAAKV